MLFIKIKVFIEMILILATLTDAIINQHSSLRGIAQQLAEVYYIVGAQQLDGYGQECFLAKDERGSEVLIGASLTGKHENIMNFSFVLFKPSKIVINEAIFYYSRHSCSKGEWPIP